jgi:hypothetical protein
LSEPGNHGKARDKKKRHPMHYHRRKFRRFRKNRDQQVREICPLCNRPINKMMTSITHKETEKKAHFDCIIKELKKSYPLKPREEIYYLGGGSFGIVEDLKHPGSGHFIIKKRFQYEEK